MKYLSDMSCAGALEQLLAEGRLQESDGKVDEKVARSALEKVRRVDGVVRKVMERQEGK